MLAYLAKRLLLLLPTVLVPVTLVFFMMQLAPGDPAAVALGNNATPEQIEVLRDRLGLNDPLYLQFLVFLKNLVSLNLGQSISLGAPVLQTVLAYGVVTLQLTLLALLIAVVFGTVAGVVAALFHNRILDRATMLLAVTGVAIPEFWLALILILVFAVNLRWFPVGGYVPMTEGPLASLNTLFLPALALGLIQAAFIARMTRSAVLDVVGEQYVATAKAKGMPWRAILQRHIMRAASVPTVTVIGLTAAVLMGGAIAVEVVFSLPGIGRLLVQAVSRRDYPLIQGIVLLVAIAYVLINLLVDLIYAVLDPRVRYE